VRRGAPCGSLGGPQEDSAGVLRRVDPLWGPTGGVPEWGFRKGSFKGSPQGDTPSEVVQACSTRGASKGVPARFSHKGGPQGWCPKVGPPKGFGKGAPPRGVPKCCP
jgi:hypothetical protein